MCGRFTQHLSWEELRRLADLIGQPRNLAPRYNIAPTTQIEVIRPAAGGNELVPMRWGLVPLWWKKPLGELPSTFNARAETVAEKLMFRSAFKARRCIIPASGFYEWTGAKAQGRLAISARQAASRWRSPGFGRHGAILRATLGSTWRDHCRSGERMVSRFHHRMPVILDWRDVGAWMAGDDPGALLRPPLDDALQEWIVSPRVIRSGAGDADPALIEPTRVRDRVSLAHVPSAAPRKRSRHPFREPNFGNRTRSLGHTRHPRLRVRRPVCGDRQLSSEALPAP
jgi:putative SOS response-associated peptidase YedK